MSLLPHPYSPSIGSGQLRLPAATAYPRTVTNVRVRLDWWDANVHTLDFRQPALECILWDLSIDWRWFSLGLARPGRAYRVLLATRQREPRRKCRPPYDPTERRH